MATTIAGLISTSDLESHYSETARRKIFYRFPQGRFPLQGLLSLMDSEETDKTKFGQFEQREQELYSDTAQSAVGAANIGPFTNSANAALLTQTGSNLVKDTEYCVAVADTTKFRERDTLWIQNVPNGAGTASVQVHGRVTAIVSATVLKFRCTVAATSVSNDTDANGLQVLITGSAAPEGGRSRTGSIEYPTEVENFTQIFRTAFNFTRNALKAGVRWDKSGVYKHTLKLNSLRHMELLEKAFLFGQRDTVNVTNDDGDVVPERLTGGVLWHIDQWEKGNTGNGGAFDYRPGGADISALDWDADDNKRHLAIGGTVTYDQFDGILERIFRYTGEESFEKVVMCGSGFIAAFNKMVEARSFRVTSLNPETESWGMQMTRWESLWGTLIFKTHPLMSQAANLRNSAFVLDVGSLGYVHAQDADTTLLKNRQNNDSDGRKDEILTECGLDMRYPERFHFIENLTGITA